MKIVFLSFLLITLLLVACEESEENSSIESSQETGEEIFEEVEEIEEGSQESIESFREAYALALQDSRCEKMYSPDNTPGPGTGRTDEFLEEVFWNEQSQAYSFAIEDGDSCLGNNRCLVFRNAVVTLYTTDESCEE